MMAPSRQTREQIASVKVSTARRRLDVGVGACPFPPPSSFLLVRMDSSESSASVPADGRPRRGGPSQRDYLVGIGLLLIVVILWTASNFLTQVRSHQLSSLFYRTSAQEKHLRLYMKLDTTSLGCWFAHNLSNSNFSLTDGKLYSVTYLNTSSFSFYLLPYLFRMYKSRKPHRSGGRWGIANSRRS